MPSSKKTEAVVSSRQDRNVFKIMAKPGDSKDELLAKTLLMTELHAATTILALEPLEVDLNHVVAETVGQTQAVNNGDMRRAEAILVSQAHTLDLLFNNLTRRSIVNMGQYLEAAERYMRLALKTQTQCRATLETLANIKNPPVVYARQANITNGPQQVNNGVAPAREIDNEQNKLSEVENELSPNTGAPA